MPRRLGEGESGVRVLGIDLGDRRVGLAVSDPLGLTAQGLPTLARKGGAADTGAIAAVCRDLEVETIVIGLPRNMDGSCGPRANMVREFAGRLRDATGLPVAEWDERLTTVAATNILLEADLSRKKRRGAVDRVAATLILQGYLDRQHV